MYGITGIIYLGGRIVDGRICGFGVQGTRNETDYL